MNRTAAGEVAATLLAVVTPLTHLAQWAGLSFRTFSIAVGLVVGKLVGVFTFTYFAVRFGLAALPAGVTWFHIAGVALLAGVGFTVAIFISGLAFDDIAIIEDAKIGIFAASIIAAITGYAVLRVAARRAEVAPRGAGTGG